jgi:lipid-A-disaccharide synthase
MVVTYKVSGLSWFLAQRLVKVPFVSIANLLVNREIIPELLQDSSTPEALAAELEPLILTDSPRRQRMLADLRLAAEKLGSGGASARVLDIIMEEIGAANARS